MEDPETYCADVTAWARSVLVGSNRRYLDALETKVLVFDGAMGTSLQNQPLTKVHRSCLEVGVDVLETDAFHSEREKEPKLCVIRSFRGFRVEGLAA